MTPLTVKRKQALIAIRPDLHKLLKDRARDTGMKLEALASEVVETGMRIKRILPAEATSEAA